MLIVKVLSLLLFHVALVTPDLQKCHDSDGNSYTVITCGAPGKDPSPGKNGVNGPKGENGEQELENHLRELQSNFDKLLKAFVFANRVTRYGNKIYVLHNVEIDYFEAKNICSQAGGQLAIPMDEHENEVLFSIRKHVNQHIFLGINDLQTQGVFKYLSGEVINYSNWGTGEPNNVNNNEHCVEIRDTGKWNDENCASKRLSICEF